MTREEIVKRYSEICKEFQTLPTKRTLPEDYIFDEEKSVKWNREEVKRHNTEADKVYKTALRKKRKAYNDLDEYCYQYLAEQYSLSLAQARLAFQFAYEEKHSFGFYEVLDYAETVVVFCKQLKESE